MIIARDYISQGLRERARDLATLELGIETEDNLQRKLAQEVDAQRFTRLDRSILQDTDQGILAITSKMSKDKRAHAHRMGRLKKLQAMGFAEELKPGVWKIADRTENTLRQLGERGDIINIMQRVLREAGVDRGISDYSIFDAAKPDSNITGKIVAIGLSNEMQDHHYVVVDGTDGKLHYAEIGRLSKYDPPSKELVVTIRGSDVESRLNQTMKPNARMFIESHIPFGDLASANGATWLDRKLLTKQPETYREKGFGAEANRALRLRQNWLVQQQLMTDKSGQLVAQRQMLKELTRRDIAKAGSNLANRSDLSHVSASELGSPNTKIVRSIRMASGRFAMMQKGKEFALVPWKQAIQMRKGKGLGIDAGKGISR